MALDVAVTNKSSKVCVWNGRENAVRSEKSTGNRRTESLHQGLEKRKIAGDWDARWEDETPLPKR